FYQPARLVELRIDVARAARDEAWPARGRAELCFVFFGVVSLVRAVLPFDAQFLAPLECRPGVVCDHRDPTQRLTAAWRPKAVDRNRSPPSAHLECGAVIKRFNFAPEDRRSPYRRAEHPIDVRIHAEDWLSLANGAQVVARHPFSYVSPFRGRLEN